MLNFVYCYTTRTESTSFQKIGHASCIQVIVFNRTDMLYCYLVCRNVSTVRIQVDGQRFNSNLFHTFFSPHSYFVIGVPLCQCSFITVYADSLTAQLAVNSVL